jgi:putative transposase
MEKFKDEYRVSSARLPEWDYTSPGYYFVTICTYHHEPFFGRVLNSKVNLSPLGDKAHKFWQETPQHFSHACLDEFVIMPNHIHGIVIIEENDSVANDTTVEMQHAVSLRYRVDQVSDPDIKPHQQSQKPSPGSLSAIIRSYKSAVTRWAKHNDYSQFAWQSRFYDHVIRDEE